MNIFAAGYLAGMGVYFIIDVVLTAMKRGREKLSRSDKDYAIEHAEYMARSAERFMDVTTKINSAVDDDDPQSAWIGLKNAIYQFRKRAARAGHIPSAEKLK